MSKIEFSQLIRRRMISLIALLTFSPSSPHGILSTLIPTISDMATAGETSGNVGRPDVEDSDVDIKGIIFWIFTRNVTDEHY